MDYEEQGRQFQYMLKHLHQGLELLPFNVQGITSTN